MEYILTDLLVYQKSAEISLSRFYKNILAVS